MSDRDPPGAHLPDFDETTPIEQRWAAALFEKVRSEDSTCLSDATLDALGRDLLDEAEEKRSIRHATTCPSCLERWTSRRTRPAVRHRIRLTFVEDRDTGRGSWSASVAGSSASTSREIADRIGQRHAPPPAGTLRSAGADPAGEATWRDAFSVGDTEIAVITVHSISDPSRRGGARVQILVVDGVDLERPRAAMPIALGFADGEPFRRETSDLGLAELILHGPGTYEVSFDHPARLVLELDIERGHD
ncbi:MAG: hypothetical protein KDC38_03030 [Planctomycetes bacterium]|nr:hypothetical protein [Planctomycetota bacterium]